MPQSRAARGEGAVEVAEDDIRQAGLGGVEHCASLQARRQLTAYGTLRGE
jgi:hypothetical protein